MSNDTKAKPAIDPAATARANRNRHFIETARSALSSCADLDPKEAQALKAFIDSRTAGAANVETPKA